MACPLPPTIPRIPATIRRFGRDARAEWLADVDRVGEGAAERLGGEIGGVEVPWQGAAAEGSAELRKQALATAAGDDLGAEEAGGASGNGELVAPVVAPDRLLGQYAIGVDPGQCITGGTADMGCGPARPGNGAAHRMIVDMDR